MATTLCVAGKHEEVIQLEEDSMKKALENRQRVRFDFQAHLWVFLCRHALGVIDAIG
jgi:hypothetical protein